MHKKRALLINEGWSDNLGDQAIKMAMEKLLQKNNYFVTFLAFTHTKKESIDIVLTNDTSTFKSIIKAVLPVKVKWILKNGKRIFLIYRANKKYDIVLIGGGQLLLNNNYFSLAFYIWTFIFRKSNIQLLGVGCSNNFSRINKHLFTVGLKKIKTINLRDQQSIVNFKKYFKFDVFETYDPVFTISSVVLLDETPGTAVGISFVNYLDFSKYNNNTKEEYKSCCFKKIKNEFKNNSLVKLFYTTSMDKAFANELQRDLLNNFNISIHVDNSKSVEDLFVLVNTYKKVISSRMHALIIAASYGKEIEAIQFSDKLIGFSNQFINTDLDIISIKLKINKIFQSLEL